MGQSHGLKLFTFNYFFRHRPSTFSGACVSSTSCAHFVELLGDRDDDDVAVGYGVGDVGQFGPRSLDEFPASDEICKNLLFLHFSKWFEF